jgi:peroxiredoxin
VTEITATTLRDRIAEFMQNMAKHAPAEVISTLAIEIRKLAESGIVKGTIAVGARAPDFSLPDARGGKVSLATLVQTGPAVVTFYRGGWCPFCDLQLRAYQGALTEIRSLGAELVAISPQTPDFAMADVSTKDLAFPVLTDAHNQVAKLYGLVFVLSDVMKGLQKGFGNPIPKFNGDDSWELPMPGTFVIDKNRVVRLAHVDPDYMKRLEPAAILDALRGLRS